MNLNPGSPRCAQNHGTSGRETSNPLSAKKLAIQRMASLFSLGTNRSTSAPTSGVNRIMERMWLYIFSFELRAMSFEQSRTCLLEARSSQLAARSSVIHVINDKPDQS